MYHHKACLAGIKVLHKSKILFGIVGGICNLAGEFNGLVSKYNRPVSTGWFLFLSHYMVKSIRLRV